MKRAQLALEAPVAPAEQPHGHGDRVRRGHQWMTVKQLTGELQFPSEDACRAWLRRQGIANVRRGRVILVSPVDVDRALRKVS